MAFDTLACRIKFPALARQINGKPAVFLDGPAGSQVPRQVIDAVSDYFIHHNANHGGEFATSRESDAIVLKTSQLLAAFLNAPNPESIVFGANMTTLTFAFSRALAATWKPGDEVIVTRLDHDANVSPWVRAAQDRGVTVRHVEIHQEDCTLDLDDFKRKLSGKTKLVAVGCASNAVGTRNPVKEMAKLAHGVGALVFLDAVHLAPHAAIDVQDWGCDFLVCSAYKFFGPHIGILWGKLQLMQSLTPYKVRPAAETLPDRWMTGTQNFECIAAVGAAVEYLFETTRLAAGASVSSRQSFVAGFQAIEDYERKLGAKLLAGLAELPSVRVYGITSPDRFAERVPTVSFTHRHKKPIEIARFLGDRGIFVWHGNYYALPLTEALGLEPDGMVRVGLLHYNVAEEVDRLIAALRELEG
ncbi:MAG: cysteine desulfurase-like protein [Planctomycetes bacterium]|nr:cysteine desulfurase-like protein [Planctomycetota bacterium]